MGISKSDLIAINGFDEDYIAPGGGEDSDIEWRLQALGSVQFYSMKHGLSYITSITKRD